MASMATLFTKTPYPPLSHHKIPNTHFAPTLKVSISLSSGRKAHRRLRVSSGLIEPDGGTLVELLVDEPLRDVKKREALSLPRVGLSRIDLQWVHVLSEGWASPLRGFMRENEFLQTLHFNALRLEDESVVNMSVPIVLAIDDSQKHRIGGSTKVALFDSDNNPVAILKK
jgi:3'-phosphoadenosine 5'-phosphosulfate synthase